MDPLLFYAIPISIAYSFIVSAISQAIVELIFYLTAKVVLKYIRGWMISWAIASVFFSLFLIYEAYHPFRLEGIAFLLLVFGITLFISFMVGRMQLRKMQREIENP
jgi:hypothetical protein